MIQSLRRTQRWLIILVAALSVVLFLAGLRVRQPLPVSPALPVLTGARP
jgi:hypothetical protein